MGSEVMAWLEGRRTMLDAGGEVVAIVVGAVGTLIVTAIVEVMTGVSDDNPR